MYHILKFILYSILFINDSDQIDEDGDIIMFSVEDDETNHYLG